MSKYKALTNIDHDGKRYSPGDIIELTDEQQVEYLQQANAIEEATADEAAAGKRPKKA
jgi:hypothetical protein